MAVTATTLTTTKVKNIREDLSDVVENLSPSDTPFLTLIGRESVKNTTFDWLEESLAAPDDANALKEGEENIADNAPNIAARLQNTLQISAKKARVSGTAEAVDGVGGLQKMAHQIMLKAKELKLDQEKILTGDQAAGVGDPRKTAAFGAFLRTNVSRGTSGASASLSSSPNGYPATAPTAGTKRVPTEAMILDVMQKAYENGGNPTTLMVGPGLKRLLSEKMSGRATQTSTDAENKTVSAVVDFFTTDFGQVKIVPNRVMNTNDRIYAIDPSKVAMVTLRGYRQSPEPVQGDVTVRKIITEYGLKVHSEKAHGIVADLKLA